MSLLSNPNDSDNKQPVIKWHIKRTEPCLTQLTWWRQQSGYLETALKQVFACDDVRDLSLVQAVGDGHRSESGVQGHDCQSQDQSVALYCRFKNCLNTHHFFVSHLRGKLYMKQACAATSHSALVSQKMAMLQWGFWPRAARPLPKHLDAW